MQTKKFQKLSEEFECSVCGKHNPFLKASCRNHCKFCLVSIHVDDNPGDRMNKCKGLMEVVDIDHSGKKGYVLVHKCKKCGEIKKNKIAFDDNFELVLQIMKDKFKIK